jgi:hypothetical protein
MGAFSSPLLNWSKSQPKRSQANPYFARLLGRDVGRFFVLIDRHELGQRAR